MARQSRLTVADYPQLVRLSANVGRQPFAGSHDLADFFETLRYCSAEARVQLHAYRLTATHALLLLTPLGDGEGLSRFIQRLGRIYGRQHNDRHGLRGSLWEGRFRSCLVEPGPCLLAVMLHVDTQQHHDAALANSADHHLGQQRQAWLADPEEYWRLGNTPFEREAQWRTLLTEHRDSLWAPMIEQSLRSGLPLGSDEFKARISLVTGRRTQPGRPGRPRRAAQRAPQA